MLNPTERVIYNRISLSLMVKRLKKKNRNSRFLILHTSDGKFQPEPSWPNRIPAFRKAVATALQLKSKSLPSPAVEKFPLNSCNTATRKKKQKAMLTWLVLLLQLSPVM